MCEDSNFERTHPTRVCRIEGPGGTSHPQRTPEEVTTGADLEAKKTDPAVEGTNHHLTLEGADQAVEAKGADPAVEGADHHLALEGADQAVEAKGADPAAEGTDHHLEGTDHHLALEGADQAVEGADQAVEGADLDRLRQIKNTELEPDDKERNNSKMAMPSWSKKSMSMTNPLYPLAFEFVLVRMAVSVESKGVKNEKNYWQM